MQEARASSTPVKSFAAKLHSAAASALWLSMGIPLTLQASRITRFRHLLLHREWDEQEAPSTGPGTAFSREHEPQSEDPDIFPSATACES